MLKAHFLTAAILAGLSWTAAAQDSPKPVDLAAEYQDLINVERAFAKKSMDTNAKEAFLAFIADDGVLFNPDPEPGKEAWQKRPAPQFTLDWWPTHADISRSADLGWTTGPWVIGLKDGKKLHGYFATVWRKQADGTWRFVTDMGASMPEAAKRGGEPGPLDPAKLEKGATPVDPKEAEGALLDFDKALGETAGKGLEEAYKPLLAEDVRLMRQEHAPFVGKEAAALRLSEEKGTFSSKPVGGGSAQAGDLGYAYGTYERKGDKPESGSYMRVWRREPGDTWKLALEVLSPKRAG
jgi:ketosteroid isomerase-like protein